MYLTSLEEHLPYSHIEDDFIIFDDGSFSAGYEMACPPIGSYSAEEKIAHSTRIETMLSQLTENASYQIFFSRTSDFQKEIAEHKKITNSHPLIQSMHAQRTEVYERLQQERLIHRGQCHLFIHFSPGRIKEQRIPFWAGLKKANGICSKEIMRFKKEFNAILQITEDNLNGAGFNCLRMSEYELMKFIYEYMNPDRSRNGILCPAAKESESFLRQVFCSDLYIDDKKGEYIHYGGYFHSYVSLKILPETTYPAMLTCAYNLPFSEFDIVVNILAKPKEWGKGKIEATRKSGYGGLHGLFGLRNKEAEALVQNCEMLLEETEQTNQKLFCMQLTIHIYSEEIEGVIRKGETVLQLFSGLNGAEMHRERWGAVEPIFVSTLPGWPRESSRLVLLKTTHLADLLPFFSDFRGSGQGECLFLNSTGGLVAYDPFSDDLPAFNMIVVGSPGSGKSFTINQIVNQYSKNDPVEIFIDIGGSYKRQVTLKGGDYIHLGLQENFTINLFDLPMSKRLSDFNEEKQNELLILKTTVIQQMMGGLARFRESDQIVEDYIFRSVVYLYHHFDNPILTDFKEALKKISETNKHYSLFYEQVTGLMGNWFKGGKYGKYTDGRSTISLDKHVICFDLKGLEQFEQLQAVMLMIVTNFVWGKIMAEPGRRKFVIFDECWKLLASPEASKFISECYRTFRKYGAGAISITQSFQDFLTGGLRGAILDNSNTRLILRQNSAKAVQEIGDYFNLNEQERRLIESLQIKKGEYSEIFFSQSKELRPVSSKVVIYPTPIEYWVATTDAMDVNYYEDLRRKNPSLSIYEAIEKCAKEYPHGVGKER